MIPLIRKRGWPRYHSLKNWNMKPKKNEKWEKKHDLFLFFLLRLELFRLWYPKQTLGHFWSFLDMRKQLRTENSKFNLLVAHLLQRNSPWICQSISEMSLTDNIVIWISHFLKDFQIGNLSMSREICPSILNYTGWVRKKHTVFERLLSPEHHSNVNICYSVKQPISWNSSRNFLLLESAISFQK